MNLLQIEFQKVCQSFGTKSVLSDFSVKLFGGRIISVTGANGSGKSTFLRLAGQLMAPDAGRIVMREDGKSLEQETYRSRIGMISPEMMLYSQLTAEENLRFYARLRGRVLYGDDIKRLLRQVGLEQAAGFTGKFSTGMRQRLKLAVLLAAEPQVWLLDEPGSNMDEDGRQILLQSAGDAARAGRLILWATNDPREEEIADENIHLS